MKRMTFVLAALFFMLAGAASTSKAVDVGVDFFYDNLSGGNWIEVGDYGYVWQPQVAVDNQAWRPYSDGYWAYTDLGWTWVSYEDFGWATYHYGRWSNIDELGWVWVPGRDADLEWGPAWVSWRYSDEYVGWAPLPPESVGLVYEGRPVTGAVDVQFDIGPSWYNFVDVRYIGEPVLRERIVDWHQNVTFVNKTVNVTNITYKNKVVYNYGPNIDVINRRAARPIQRLKIERQQNVDVMAAARSGGLLKPQGDRLIVAAPMHIRKALGQTAPHAVNTRIEKAKVNKGWAEVGDENARNQLKQQLRAQKSGPGAGTAVTGAGAGAPHAKGDADPGRGRHDNKRNERENAAAGAAEGSPAEAGANEKANPRAGANALSAEAPAPVAPPRPKMGDQAHPGQKEGQSGAQPEGRQGRKQPPQGPATAPSPTP